MDLLATLRPMDVLLYGGTSLFDVGIKVLTRSDVCHSETYIGDGQTAASRNGLGVNTYPFSPHDLTYVLRPVVPFDFAAALAWHESVIGQKYDWKGILVFELAAAQGAQDRMFCSEHTHRMAKRSGYFPFGHHADADKTAPGFFEWSALLAWVYPFRAAAAA